MKILYLHQYFATRESSTGTRSYEFARRLVASGHEVLVLTSPAMLPKGLWSPDETVPRTLDIDGIQVRVLPVPYANSMGFEERGRAFLDFAFRASHEVVKHRADLVFATSTPLTIALPALAAHWRHRIPLVFEVRDLWPEVPIAVGALRNPALRVAANGLERLVYRSSRRIVALSPGMKAGVVRRGIPEERVVVIPNSCDVDMFDVPPERGESFRREFGCTAPEQPLVVYTGTFGLINGVEYLVRVAEQMRTFAPEVRFALVGAGAMRQQVTELATELGVLGQNLVIRAPVPKSQMPDVLAAATVATSTVIPIPALWHNSANKFFDSLAAGKPMVINHCGWQADLLRETGAGLALPEADHRRAAEELATFLRDKARLTKAAESARRLARERFSRDDLAHQFQETLVAAAGNQQGR